MKIKEALYKCDKMIVKVQLPLSSNSDEPLALVYDKDRSFELYLHIDHELKKGMGKRYKAFFEASFTKDKDLKIDFDSEVKDPGW